MVISHLATKRLHFVCMHCASRDLARDEAVWAIKTTLMSEFKTRCWCVDKQIFMKQPPHHLKPSTTRLDYFWAPISALRKHFPLSRRQREMFVLRDAGPAPNQVKFETNCHGQITDLEGGWK